MFKSWENDNDFHYSYDKKHFVHEVRQWLKDRRDWVQTEKAMKLSKVHIHLGLAEYAARSGRGNSEDYKKWFKRWSNPTTHVWEWKTNEYVESAIKTYATGVCMIRADEFQKLVELDAKRRMNAAYYQYVGSWFLANQELIAVGKRTPDQAFADSQLMSREDWESTRFKDTKTVLCIAMVRMNLAGLSPWVTT